MWKCPKCEKIQGHGNNMNNRQKNTILSLLKADEANREFKNKYWFSYEDFLNPTDYFTAFSCEEAEGKQRYITVIEHLLNKDNTAKIFVEVYGVEVDDSEQVIYADTMMIFSRLSLSEIKNIFYEPKDIFPSDIGEMTDLPQEVYLVGVDGSLISSKKLCDDDHSIYYCWWD